MYDGRSCARALGWAQCARADTRAWRGRPVLAAAAGARASHRPAIARVHVLPSLARPHSVSGVQARQPAAARRARRNASDINDKSVCFRRPSAGGQRRVQPRRSTKTAASSPRPGTGGSTKTAASSPRLGIPCVVRDGACVSGRSSTRRTRGAATRGASTRSNAQQHAATRSNTHDSSAIISVMRPTVLPMGISSASASSLRTISYLKLIFPALS